MRLQFKYYIRLLSPSKLSPKLVLLSPFFLPSAPYNNLVEEQDYNLEEALKAVVPSSDTSETYETPSGTPCDDHIAQRPLRSPSYLSQFLLLSYNHPDTIPLRFHFNTSPSSHHRTISHPQWRKWNAVWNAAPIELDTTFIPQPTIEETLYDEETPYSLLLQLHLAEKDLPRPLPLFKQGTTIVFKGDDTSNVRYVVEWSQKTEGDEEYLVVVATSKNRFPYPYNDPNFPTFTLVVPSYLSNVPGHPLNF